MNKSLDEKHKENAKKALAEAKARKKKEIAILRAKEKNGPNACPFNYLYWDFLVRNRDLLQSNHRVSMMYKTYDRMDENKKNAIHHDSQLFLNNLT